MARDEHLRLTSRKPGQFSFAGRGDGTRGLTTRQYARLVQKWVANIGLDPAKFGTHSLDAARRQRRLGADEFALLLRKIAFSSASLSPELRRSLTSLTS